MAGTENKKREDRKHGTGSNTKGEITENHNFPWFFCTFRLVLHILGITDNMEKRRYFSCKNNPKIMFKNFDKQ